MLVLFLGFNSGRKNTLDLLNEVAVRMMDTIEIGVRNHLEPAIHQLDHIQHLVDIGALDPTDKESLEAVLLGALAAAPQVHGIIFWDLDMKSIQARRNPRRGILTQASDDSGIPEIVLLVEKLKESPGHIWGELAFTRFAFVNVNRAITRNGVPIGFAGAAVTIPELSRLMEQVGEQFEATAFIRYGDDQILAHPYLMTGHPDQSAGSPAVGINALGDLILANMETRYPVIGFESASEKAVGVEGIDLFGQTHVMFTRTINDFGDTAWTLGAHVPVDLINRELRRLVGSAAVGLLVFVLSIVAAIILGRIIARPIKRSAAGAAQVAEFNISEIRPLQASFIRELNNQANAFNTMLTGLKWFESYVPRSLVKRLVQTGALEHIESQEMVLTVMFTDIVGFTPLSEELSAYETADLLNHHFSLIGDCVEGRGGTIDKYIGDSLMAFWGAPDQQEDHASRAVKAAIEIRDALALDNRNRPEGRPPVQIRIGIHTGPVIVGNIGSADRINYTIVGDTVNVGQRIESLGKEWGDGEDAVILISAATAAGLAGGIADLSAIGAVELKGRREKIEVYRVV